MEEPIPISVSVPARQQKHNTLTIDQCGSPTAVCRGEGGRLAVVEPVCRHPIPVLRAQVSAALLAHGPMGMGVDATCFQGYKHGIIRNCSSKGARARRAASASICILVSVINVVPPRACVGGVCLGHCARLSPYWCGPRANQPPPLPRRRQVSTTPCLW